MSKAKGVTPEIKERLRLVAQAKKGRASMSGLERSGLWMALDALREGVIAPVCVYPSSYAEQFGVTLHDAKHLDVRLAYTFLARVRSPDQGEFSPDGKFSRSHVRWVRFRNTPDDILKAMADAMETIQVRVPIYGGPGVGSVGRDVTLFSVVPAMLVLKFLFGEPKLNERANAKVMNWKVAVDKYLTGYTERYVQYRRHIYPLHPLPEPLPKARDAWA